MRCGLSVFVTILVLFNVLDISARVYKLRAQPSSVLPVYEAECPTAVNVL